MKKILVVILAVLFTLSFGATAFAEGEESAPPKPAEQVSPQYASDVLSVLPKYKNDHMDKTYQQGYVPKVDGNKVYIVLPLKVDKNKLGPGMKEFGVSLDLGGRSDVFDVKNYDKKIAVKNLTGDNGDQLIVEFVPRLVDGHPGGAFPVYVNVTYTKLDENGKEVPVTEAFLLYVNLQEAVIPPGPEPEPEPEPTDGGVIDGGGGGGGGGEGATSQPKVIMSEYKVTPDPVDAGNTFTVTGKLLNTSDKTAVKNMTVTFKSEGSALMPLGGGSTIYIDKIDKQCAAEFAIKMSVRADAEPGVQKISVAYDYEGGSTAYQGSDEISVQVRQPIRLEYDQPTFPSAVSVGESGQASLNLYNKGKGRLYNVSVTLEVPGITPESSAFLGNMESGVAKTADIYFNVDSGVVEESFTEEEIIDEGKAAEAAGFEEAIAVPASGGAVVMNRPVAAEAATEEAVVEPSGEGKFVEEFQIEGSAAAGPAVGNMVVTYEDEFGETLEMKIPVETEIMPAAPPIDEGWGEEVPEEPAGPAMPWWVWVIIAGVAAAVVGGVLAAKKKKKREQQLLEEMDEDESA